MAAQQKCYYPWESWKRAAEERGMHFLKVFFRRNDYPYINRVSVSAPYTRREVVGGVAHMLILRRDVNYRSDGTAYDSKGRSLKEFDLKLSDVQ